MNGDPTTTPIEAPAPLADTPKGPSRAATARTVSEAVRLLRASTAAQDPDVARVIELLGDLADGLHDAAAGASGAPTSNPAGAAGSVGPGGLGYVMALSPEEENAIDWGAHDKA